MKQEIKNIIFDLGNVILDLDFKKAAEAFLALSGVEFNTFTANEEIRNIFLQFELGHYSEESFLNAIQRKINPVPDARQLIETWNSLLDKIPENHLNLLDQLNTKGYRLYLLSNTNSLHIKWLKNYLENEHGILDFNTRFFKKSYYSYLLNMRKPDKEIFNFVLADAQLITSETLFIDDSVDNIKTASEMGIATILHKPGSNLQKVFQPLL